jgi:preprotein translocase subunit YajC
MMMGKVTAVNGSTLTIEESQQQNTLTVALTVTTQVFKQSPLEFASIPVGETVNLNGTQATDVFTAQQIRVGADSGFGGSGQNNTQGQAGALPTGGPQGDPGQPLGQGHNGAPPSNGNTQASDLMGQRLCGTVENVSSDTLTVKTTDGTSLKVKLASGSQVTQQVTAATADLTSDI